jgi:nucleotide-binding universal stress UspA family protein
MTTNDPGILRIVVGLDLAKTGNHALCEAMSLARRTHSELHVTHVLRTEGSDHNARKLAELEEAMNARLDEMKEHVPWVRAPKAGEGAFTQEIVFHVRLGEPAEALHQVAVDVGASLIVVGTHGRSGMEKLVLGSVAEELVRTARLPVLVARPSEIASLPKTQRPDAPKPGVDLHNRSASARMHLEFLPRTSHISGLL